MLSTTQKFKPLSPLNPVVKQNFDTSLTPNLFIIHGQLTNDADATNRANDRELQETVPLTPTLGGGILTVNFMDHN